jgi:hypothetical protein
MVESPRQHSARVNLPMVIPNSELNFGGLLAGWSEEEPL